MSWLGELGGPFRWTSLSCAGLIARRPGHGKRGAPAEISTMHGGIHNNAQLARWPAGRLQVALTTLRKLIGRHSLDEVLKEREELAATMCRAIDTATKPWRGWRRAIWKFPNRCSTPWRRKPRLCAKSARASSSVGKGARGGQADHGQSGRSGTARMQMVTQVGAEQNTATIIMMPSEFVSMARGIGALAERRQVFRRRTALRA